MTHFRRVNARTVFACAGLWIALTGSAAQAQIRPRLSGPEIAEAIQAGIAGNAAPYPLFPPGRFGEEALAAGVRAPALVYTPFVRVALQAKAAYDSGNILTPADVDSAALEPVVYIGFTIRACCGEREERLNGGALRILAVFDPRAIRSAATAARARRDPRARPLWTRAGTAPLLDLGIDPPAHLEAVAAFSADVINAAREFQVSRSAPDGTAGVFGFYAPVRADTRRWR